VAHEFQASSKRHKNHFISMHLKRNRLRSLLKNGSLTFLLRTLPKTLYDLGKRPLAWSCRAWTVFIGHWVMACAGAKRLIASFKLHARA